MGDKMTKIMVKCFAGLKAVLEWIRGRMLVIFTVVVCLALLIGWRLSRQELITPSHGIGYRLGNLGAVSMLILMIYPLRKRIKSLAVLGSVKQWFSLHMMLGIIGPVLVLYHANFHLGAWNSNVALITMLVVAGSGVIGRYIYTKIYQGLSGQRRNLIELKKELEQQKEDVHLHFARIPGVQDELFGFADKVTTLSKELTHSVKRLWTIRWQTHDARRRIHHIMEPYLDAQAQENKWTPHQKRHMRKLMRNEIEQFLSQTVIVAKFNFYERVFFLWHELHVPLVSLLAFAVLLHVLAANRY